MQLQSLDQCWSEPRARSVFSPPVLPRAFAQKSLAAMPLAASTPEQVQKRNRIRLPWHGLLECDTKNPIFLFPHSRGGGALVSYEYPANRGAFLGHRVRK
jgi:hypothetical protein